MHDFTIYTNQYFPRNRARESDSERAIGGYKENGDNKRVELPYAVAIAHQHVSYSLKQYNTNAQCMRTSCPM